MKKPKTLYMDVESIPNVQYAYDLWNGSKPDMIIKERAIVTFAYSWEGEKTVHVITSAQFQPKGKFNPYNDEGISNEIAKILTEADYVVAHYGDKFDMRMIRARLLLNGLHSIPHVTTIDTYKLAKKYFHLNANRLDYLGKALGLGGKLDTGWKLWRAVSEGDLDALNKMATYNKRDVDLLKKVFKKLLPHVTSNLNYRLFTAKEVCPHCNSSNVQKRGVQVTKSTKRQRMHCQSCGTWYPTKYKEEDNG